MKDKLFKKFRETGLISDYLKYREEIARENQNGKESRRNNPKFNRLQRKP